MRTLLAEIVEDGVTGFLVANEDQAVAAVHEVRHLERGRCRIEAERLFSVQRLVDDRVRLYRRIAAASPTASSVGRAAPAADMAS